MLPFLREADELIVIPTDVVKLVPGDIVTYLDDDKFPTHRVVENLKTKKSFLIQGDNTPKKKLIVPYDIVVGKVVARKRNGKWISQKHVLWKLASLMIINRERLKSKWRKFKTLDIFQARK